MRENLIQRTVRDNLQTAMFKLDINYDDFENLTSFSKEFLIDFMRGDSSISLEYLFYICSKLNLSADFIFGFSDVVRPTCYTHSALLALDSDKKKAAEDYIAFLLEKQEKELEFIPSKEA